MNNLANSEPATRTLIISFTPKELHSRLASAINTEEFSVLTGVHAIVVEGDDPIPDPPSQPQCPVIAMTTLSDPSAVFDITVNNEVELHSLVESIERSPIAVQCLLQLLRNNERVSVPEALFAESLTYSTLQHGEQFTSWLGSRSPPKSREEPNTPPILVKRQDDLLELILDRPAKRNAWSTDMRDALTEVLQLVSLDGSIERVVLRANGPCFGAGGDLDEFGTARDAGLAHVTRMTRSPALLMHRCQNKISVKLHGACVGAGIEIPAFASHVSAKLGAYFQLPEVRMGLIPGAGGTASILARIGRRNLAKMAITGERIDVETALQWGLIDEILKRRET